jgi:NAD(P)H dehydrogenase (quinone)
MRLLVVFAHPSDASYGAAIFARAVAALEAGGHALRIRDLYRDGFDPVLSRTEWDRYLTDTAANIATHAGDVADLAWAEGLVVIYPTWFYGPPAMLKGWLERVWLPGVSFEVAAGRYGRPRPKLRNIRLFVGITTSGSPWWWLRVIRDPGRSLWTRGLRPLFHPRVRVIWRQLHDMNHATPEDRNRFLDKIGHELRKIPN